MTYIKEFEAELTKILVEGTQSTDATVRWISQKVLESYRNGISAGQKGKKLIPKNQSRAGDSPTEAQ